MTNILKTIRERHSTREPFDPSRSVEKEDLKLILEAARWAPTMQNFEILLVDAKERLDAIARIPGRNVRGLLPENYQQLSFSKEELHIKRRQGCSRRCFLLLGPIPKPGVPTPITRLS